jgi:hypothetical protein
MYRQGFDDGPENIQTPARPNSTGSRRFIEEFVKLVLNGNLRLPDNPACEI